jgi:uncharacterized membrane protein YraQ (UPF0718 family)
MMSLLRNKAFVLASVLLVGIAIQFWVGSRVPALDQKALMAGTAAIEPLAFDTVFVVQAEDPVWKKITFGFVNWAKTNQRGMTFGFMFAAGILCLLSMFKRKSLEGNFSNSALGVMIGTPLGVCVNCAAPIARGLHESGMRLETTLAAMISSPTLNVIVLTMVIALFPMHLVVLKIGGTLFVLFVAIPLLSRYVFKDEVIETSGERQVAAAHADDDAKYMPLDAEPPAEHEENKWWPAIKWLIVSYLRNLWFILRSTLPLMILAGVLGTIVVTLIPLDTLSTILPSSPKIMVLLAMVITALVGLFLPVPITFDVIVVAVLISAGMPIKYAMILLFTLGIFSIYSYLIVHQAISRKVAAWLFFVIAGIGVVTGVIANEYDKWYSERKEAFLIESWAEQKPIVIELAAADAGDPLDVIQPQLDEYSLRATAVAVDGPADIAVTAVPLNAVGSGGDRLFSRVSGPSIGINQPYQFSVVKWAEPYSEFRGIASGDVHNDGWPDIVVTSERGVYLYANVAGKFHAQEIAIEGLSSKFVVNAALVDLNNDGWMDLYYSVYRGGNYVVYNNRGSFTQVNQVRLPNQDEAWMTAAPAFADLDQDGDLDIVLGNWTLGSALSRVHRGRTSSRNVILWNTGTRFEMEELTGEPGETLTILVTDYSGDGIPDMIVGNDFQVPDLFYLGTGDGRFRLLKRSEHIVPISTLLTMSASAADINNDLQQEIYLANASGTDRSMMSPIDEICEEVEGTEYYDACVPIRNDQVLVNASLRRSDPFTCGDLSEQIYVEQCIGMQISLESWWKRRRDMCDKLQGRFEDLAVICEEYFRVEDRPINEAYKNEIPQAARRTNVLLVRDAEGVYSDVALEMNVREAGWVWNAQFADLDQDEYQDLYIANGMFFENPNDARESNHFFHNDAGENFVDQTEESGLSMFAENSAYTYVDIDNDGDLDIVAVEALGPVWAFINNQSDNAAVTFELRDHSGNHFGIGSRIIAHYGEDGASSQLREIRSSGGFISFNAPVAHFGIAQHEAVTALEIQWSTGETSTLSGDFRPGSRYIISRR